MMKVIKERCESLRNGTIKFFQGGYHYWLALGMAIAFCLHQGQIILTQRLLAKEMEAQVGLISPSEEHDRRGESFACDWYPDFTTDCEVMLNARLPLDTPHRTLHKKRWLFLGDSTIKRLFEHSALRTQLIVEPHKSLSKLYQQPDPCWEEEARNGLLCQQRMSERCRLNDFLDLPYATEWKMPDQLKFEGPLKYGLNNNYCTDCSGCQSNFLDCQVKKIFDIDQVSETCTKKRLTYGGYLSIEFARDVEIQSPKYSTTQENIAEYLRRSWNEPTSPLMLEWGLPICVINTGNHDSMLPGITVDDFVKNVKWYLDIYKYQCAHMIWLSSTAPRIDNTNYVQTGELMKMYDNAVKDLITNTRSLRRMMSFINIFDASKDWPHADHIHMDNEWYAKFGQWMVSSFMV